MDKWTGPAGVRSPIQQSIYPIIQQSIHPLSRHPDLGFELWLGLNYNTACLTS